MRYKSRLNISSFLIKLNRTMSFDVILRIILMTLLLLKRLLKLKFFTQEPEIKKNYVLDKP